MAPTSPPCGSGSASWPTAADGWDADGWDADGWGGDGDDGEARSASSHAVV